MQPSAASPFFHPPMYTMPLRRRRAPRRAMIRRRRLARRPMRRPMRPSNIHHFKRTAFYSGLIAGSTLSDVSGGFIAQLSQVPNFGEFTSLFDMYRINGVRWRISPRANSAEVGSNQGLIKLFTAIDYDDITTPSLPDMLQYESLKVSQSDKEHVRYVKPRIANQVYQTGVGTGYGSTRGWIDCQNTTVAHYGLKYLLQQLPAGNQSFDVQVTYYLSFKNVV